MKKIINLWVVQLILKSVRLHSAIDKIHYSLALVIPSVTYLFLEYKETIDESKTFLEYFLFFITLLPLFGKLLLKLFRYLDKDYPIHLDLSLSKFIDCEESISQVTNSEFRVRFIKTTEFIKGTNTDILSFVSLSENSPTIAAANPELSHNDRVNLYHKWFSKNPKSFMLLEKRTSKNKFEVIGISIILLLTNTAKEALLDGETNVLVLRSQDLCSIPEFNHPNLLIDTLIAKDKTDGLIFTLLMKHISEFWMPSKHRKVSFIVEPDRKSLYSVLVHLGFKNAKAKHSPIYYLEIPTFTDYNEKLKRKYAKIISKINRLHNWKVI